MRRALPFAFLVACGACEGGPLDSAEPLEPISHTFPAIEIAAFDEQYSDCQSWTLDNDEPLFVNAVDMAAGPGWHHSNWMFVDEALYDGPDGTWDCDERGYEEVEAGLAGGPLFAQSTQAEAETQQFPPNHALIVPERSRVVAKVHLLNVAETPLSTALSLTLHPLADSEALTKLRPFVLTYLPLALPPQEDSVFSSTCDAAGANSDDPLDFSLFYLLPHYHGWGTSYFLRGTGPGVDITVYDEEHTTGSGDGWGRMFTPPVDLTGVTTIEFGCRYSNTTESVIYEGNAEGEMCTSLAYSNDNRRWVGGVLNGPSLVTGTNGNGASIYTAPCQMTRLGG